MRAISKKGKKLICKNCGKKTNYISLNGNCIKCSENKINSNVYQLKSRKGPSYDKWKNKLLESIQSK